MDSTAWFKQESDEPLFPEIDWARPETKRRGGKLLIVGGNHHSFRRLASAYEVASQNKVGSIRVAAPDALKPVLSQLIPEEAAYLKSNASGGIGLEAKEELLSYAEWANSVILAGDIGRNSETPQVLDAFINRYHGQLTLTADGADVVSFSYQALIARENTHFVISLAQLQNIFRETSQTSAITSNMGVVKLVEVLQNLTSSTPIAITTYLEGKLHTALEGKVGSTPFEWNSDDPAWRVPMAAKQAAYWMQHSETPFKALVAAHIEERDGE